MLNDPYSFWNQISLDLVAADHTPPSVTSQGGPVKTARALGIIHAALHDAYALVTGNFAALVLAPPAVPALPTPLPPEFIAAALGAAGRLTCERLYPNQSGIWTQATIMFDLMFPDNGLATGPAETLGEDVAQAWLDQRTGDGSEVAGVYVPSDAAGHHRPDPHHPNQGYSSPAWGKVDPFVFTNLNQVSIAMPPALDSKDYAADYDEVVVFGKDDIRGKNAANRARAVIGIFWGYDGPAKLGTPPRLYNQVARVVIENAALSMDKLVQTFTAVNLAMADAGIAAWEWKYKYKVWRPVLGVREADAGWGPLGMGDKNPHRKQKGDPFWCPLGAPNTNSDVNNGLRPSSTDFTPGFPAYPSGHATFGTAAFLTLAGLLKKKPKLIKFEFTSDEFDGVNRDSTGVVRPRYRKKLNLEQAIIDNLESRVWLGVHWRFDAKGGLEAGKKIADLVVAKFGGTKQPAPKLPPPLKP